MSKIQRKIPLKETTPKMSPRKKAVKAFWNKIEMISGTMATHPSHPRSNLGKANVSKAPERIVAAKGNINLKILFDNSRIG
jgi:hypothetical protein